MSMTSNMSDNAMKLNYLNSPMSHNIRSYNANVHGDSDTKSVGSKSTTSRTSKLTYSGKKNHSLVLIFSYLSVKFI